MSEQNLDAVEAIFERWRAGDSALDAFDPAIEWDARHFPDGQIYHGHEGVQEFIRTWIGTWDDYDIEVEALHDAGDQVVMLTRERGLGKGSNVPMEVSGAMIVTLSEGKVIRWRAFLERAEAMEEAGLA